MSESELITPMSWRHQWRDDPRCPPLGWVYPLATTPDGPMTEAQIGEYRESVELDEDEHYPPIFAAMSRDAAEAYRLLIAWIEEYCAENGLDIGKDLEL